MTNCDTPRLFWPRADSDPARSITSGNISLCQSSFLLNVSLLILQHSKFFICHCWRLLFWPLHFKSRLVLSITNSQISHLDTPLQPQLLCSNLVCEPEGMRLYVCAFVFVCVYICACFSCLNEQSWLIRSRKMYRTVLDCFKL